MPRAHQNTSRRRRKSGNLGTTGMTSYERVMAMVALGTLAVSVTSIIISMVQTSAMRQELKWKLQQGSNGSSQGGTST